MQPLQNTQWLCRLAPNAKFPKRLKKAVPRPVQPQLFRTPLRQLTLRSRRVKRAVPKPFWVVRPEAPPHQPDGAQRVARVVPALQLLRRPCDKVVRRVMPERPCLLPKVQMDVLKQGEKKKVGVVVQQRPLRPQQVVLQLKRLKKKL